MNPEQLMESMQITHEELIKHWIAYDYLSYHTSEAKVKALPLNQRQKIGELYAKLRKQGIWPGKPKNEKMQFLNGPIIKKSYPQEREYFDAKCDLSTCNGCISLEYCRIRGREWFKNINTLISQKRALGEGKQMAEDIIKFMTKDFMGGT